MQLKTKRTVIGVLGVIFLASLVLVQAIEVIKKREEAGITTGHVSTPAASKRCVDCHQKISPGIVDQWKFSTHAQKGIGCVKCHQADVADADSFKHHGVIIATIVTPYDCARCHEKEQTEFAHSHHSKAANILASLDNTLAETVEGSRTPFNPHSPTPGKPDLGQVNGMASVFSGCMQCHGSKVALLGKDGEMINFEDLDPDPKTGQPRNKEALANVVYSESEHRPKFHPSTWPNTGIGRINLDGSRGSCSACHSRHDFSPRRARQPENCGKCHLGPDHPQKEIYEESKHGVAFRDMKEHMNLDSDKWVLGKDYTQAPTCATCHMSANTKDEHITHDPGTRLSWTNRPPVSMVLDTDENHKVIKETDEAKRAKLIKFSAESKRDNMKQVCSHCHTTDYINAFYKQYDDFIVLYNEKFAKPGKKIMGELKTQGLISSTNFDEEIEWTWFYLWHHEGRRARHGASMMAPDYAHWHGMYEVAERFYMELIPQAREIAKHAAENGKEKQAAAVNKTIDDILKRPEHVWFKPEKLAELKNAAKRDVAKAKTVDKKELANFLNSIPKNDKQKKEKAPLTDKKE